MAIVYRTDGAWGTGKGSNLAPAEVDGNFYDLDTRVTYWEDNPPLPIEPVSITITGYNFYMGLSNGETLGPVIMTMPVPEWRGEWTPATPYHDMDFFTAPDGGFGAVMQAHTSAATFDWAALGTNGLANYRQIVGSSGGTVGVSDLTDVALSGLATGDMLVWDGASSYWRNLDPAEVADNFAVFGGDTGAGGTQGMVPAPAAGDGAAHKFLSASGAWVVPATGSGGSTSLAGLSDVSISGPVNGSLLQYFASDGKWHNATFADLGAGTVTRVDTTGGVSGGPITTTGTLSLTPIAAAHLLANPLGATAAPSDTSLSQLLDAAVSADRGTVLRRDATGWTALAPGSDGQYLRSGGSGADVSWGSPAGLGTVTAVYSGTGLAGGPIVASGTLSLAPIATATLLANTTGGSAAPASTSVSTLLDAAVGNARGMLLRRDATGWSALSPGTAGQVLTTGGSGADVSWAAGGGSGSSGLSGMFPGQIPIAATATTVTSSGDLSGDVSTSGSLVTTLAAVNSTVGTFQGLTVDAKGRVTAATNQSYLNANQTITLSGDVSGGGATAITTTIGAGAVTYAKVQNVAAARLLGNPTGSAAAPSEITLGTNLSFSGTTLNAAGGAGTTPTVTTKTANYTVVAGDLDNTLVLAGSGGTLTLPAGIFTPGKSLTIHVAGTGSWAVTNSTGLTLVGNNSVGPKVGTAGTYVANADGTTLNFVPGMQVPTTTSLGGVNAFVASTNNFLTGVNSSGTFLSAQPSFSNISGTLGISAGGTGATTAAAAATNLSVLPLSGGTLTGALTVTGNLTATGTLKVGSATTATIVEDASFTNLASPDGSGGMGGIALGAAASGTHLYRNAGHYFQDRNATVGFCQFTSAGTANVSGAWTVISDPELKENVTPYERGLEAIIKLEPVQFQYRAGTPFATESEPSKMLIGLLADQVEPHVPEIVGSTTATIGKTEKEVQSLEPGLLVFALVNSVKELAARIQQLEDMLAGAAR